MTCSVLQKFLKQLNTLMDLVNIFRVTSDVFLRQKNVRERNRDFMNIKGASHSDERQRETVTCSGVLATEIPMCSRGKHPQLLPPTSYFSLQTAAQGGKTPVGPKRLTSLCLGLKASVQKFKKVE